MLKYIADTFAVFTTPVVLSTAFETLAIENTVVFENNDWYPFGI
jgi:hypothetical protein